jgi:hypothetical protein
MQAKGREREASCKGMVVASSGGGKMHVGGKLGSFIQKLRYSAS